MTSAQINLYFQKPYYKNFENEFKEGRLTLSGHWALSLPLENIRNQRFSDFFRGHRKRPGMKWFKLVFVIFTVSEVAVFFILKYQVITESFSFETV